MTASGHTAFYIDNGVVVVFNAIFTRVSLSPARDATRAMMMRPMEKVQRVRALAEGWLSALNTPGILVIHFIGKAP